MTHWHDTQQWQQWEREADADLASERYEDFDSIDAMIADLEITAEGAVTTVCPTDFLSFHRPADRRQSALSVGHGGLLFFSSPTRRRWSNDIAKRCHILLTERVSEGAASLRRRWGFVLAEHQESASHPAGERPGARSVRQ